MMLRRRRGLFFRKATSGQIFVTIGISIVAAIYFWHPVYVRLEAEKRQKIAAASSTNDKDTRTTDLVSGKCEKS